MGGEGSGGRAGQGRANRGAKQLPRRASSSHLPLKFREQGHITRQPEHHNKLASWFGELLNRFSAGVKGAIAC